MQLIAISGCGNKFGQLLTAVACARKEAGLFDGSRSVPVSSPGGGAGGQGGTGTKSGTGTNSGAGGQGSGGTSSKSGAGGQGGSGNGGRGGGTTGGQGGSGTTSQRQPLGELVGVGLELIGLKGQPVALSWSIFPENGQTHLPEKWLGNFVIYRLRAATEDDTGTVDMWIPLPRQRGRYFIRVTLAIGDNDLASMNSGPFG